MTTSHLAELDVTHGDLKPGNILMFPSDTETPIPKLIDFGYSSIVLLRDDKLAIGRTWGWAAPEWTGSLFTLRSQEDGCIQLRAGLPASNLWGSI